MDNENLPQSRFGRSSRLRAERSSTSCFGMLKIVRDSSDSRSLRMGLGLVDALVQRRLLTMRHITMATTKVPRAETEIFQAEK